MRQFSDRDGTPDERRSRLRALIAPRFNQGPGSGCAIELRDFCLNAAEWLETGCEKERFEELGSRPAVLKDIADNQPDHAAAPRIRETADDACAVLESLLSIAAGMNARLR